MDKKLHSLMIKTYYKYSTEYYMTEYEIYKNIRKEIFYSNIGTPEEREKAYKIIIGKIKGLHNYRKNYYFPKAQKALNKNNILNNIPYDRAMEFVRKQLINANEISKPDKKFLLAYALKIIVCTHLGINPNQIGIFYNKDKEDQAEASWRNWGNYLQTQDKSEMYGRIVIRNSLLSSSNIYTIFSLLHELGHVKQDYIFNNGRPSKSLENYNEYNYGENALGQFISGHFWTTDTLEIEAEAFALETLKNLINHYIKNGTPKEDLIDAIKYIKDMEKYLKITQGFHKIIHKPMCFLIDNNIL